jgi:hypothetical protein
VQRHVTPFCVASERVHKSHFISLWCNCNTTAAEQEVDLHLSAYTNLTIIIVTTLQPNKKLTHILMPTDKKPVTRCRDCSEVPLEQGGCCAHACDVLYQFNVNSIIEMLCSPRLCTFVGAALMHVKNKKTIMSWFAFAHTSIPLFCAPLREG